MLTIKNLKNIEGKEFQLANGTKYLIGLVNDQPKHYSFGVFELDDLDVANIQSAIVFQLQKELFDNGYTYGYRLSSDRMNGRVPIVVQQNLTLENFVLELHMATGRIINKT